MSRATPLPAAERRRTLIAATQPLLLEHGLAVSTRQIAEAAGVAEGTIFRAFACKSDLLDAALADALSHDGLLAALDALADAPTLGELTTGVVTALHDHARRTRAFLALVEQRADAPADSSGATGAATTQDHRARSAQLVTHLAGLLAPHRAELSVDPHAAAGALLAVSYGALYSAGAPAPAAVANLLLNGIRK